MRLHPLSQPHHFRSFFCIYIDGFIGGVKGQLWVWAGCPMCAELPPCVKATVITSPPSQADNEALFTSLSPQLTAAGTNGIVLTPPPRPSPRPSASLLLLWQSYKGWPVGQQAIPKTRTTHLTGAGVVRQGGVTAVTVRLETKQHVKIDTVTTTSLPK